MVEHSQLESFSPGWYLVGQETRLSQQSQSDETLMVFFVHATNKQADLSDSKLGESICKQRESSWRMTSSGGMSYFVRGIHTQASRTSDPKRERQLQKENNLNKLGFEALSQEHDSKIGRPHGEGDLFPLSLGDQANTMQDLDDTASVTDHLDTLRSGTFVI